MKAGSVNGSGFGMKMVQNSQGTDAYSKSIESRIVAAEKELQGLSEDKEMSAEEKMKKRQEIRQKITELENQLRQHQTRQRREMQQQRNSTAENLYDGITRESIEADLKKSDSKVTQGSVDMKI